MINLWSSSDRSNPISNHSDMLPPTNPEIKGNLQEIKGNLQESPFAELLAETTQARLSGSFRLEYEEKKAIIYLTGGDVVFAVSNLRQHRLFELVLLDNQFTKEIFSGIPNFTNDMELAQALIHGHFLSKAAVDKLFSQQVGEILKTVIQWRTGNWTFSHLARAKGNIQFLTNTTDMLIKYARYLPAEIVSKRFRSFEEKFAQRETFSVNLNLLPQEAFVFSRLTTAFTSIHDLKNLCGLPEPEILKTLYVLWMGNLITRKNWNAVFSDNRIREMLAAKLVLKKEALEPSAHTPLQNEKVTENTQSVEIELEIPENDNDEQKLLENYLNLVETAASFYEILDVPINAKVSEIKTAYFQLAKKYHPDRFHQEADTTLQQRVQNAFTEIARAYETLKDEKTREVYDYKLRKYLETVKEKIAAGEKVKSVTDVDKAHEEFDQGFNLLMEEDYEKAIPFLTRATQLSPDNARYHAYFGKALSFVGNQRHKAEAEIRQAIKLDSSNPIFRIMLAEFYIQFNLLKRAEGELQRLLVQFPNNREAEVLLASLANK